MRSLGLDGSWSKGRASSQPEAPAGPASPASSRSCPTRPGPESWTTSPPPELSRHPGAQATMTSGPATIALTRRQREILECLSRGLTMAQVAEELVLGVETVRSTAKAIYKRLGVHDREAAIQVVRMSGDLP